VSTRGYLVLGAVLLALVAYLVWPEGGGDEERWDLLERRPAGGFVVTTADFHQEVRGDRVTINGIDRPVDRERVDELWRTLEGAASPAPPIEPDGDLAAYGIGPEVPVIRAAGLELRWGLKDATTWIHAGHEGRLYRFEAGAAARLDELAGRLDRRALLAEDWTVSALEVDGHRLATGGDHDHWRFVDAADRPHADGRVAALLRTLGELPWNRFEGTLPAEAEEVFRVALGHADGTAGLVVHAHGGHAWVQPPEGPPQGLAPAELERLRQQVAAFDRDLLFDHGVAGRHSPVDRVVVRRGGRELFTAQRPRDDDLTPAGESTWELVWPGGRETASPAPGRRYLAALQALEVRAPRRRAAALTAPPPGGGAEQVTVRLEGNLPGGAWWLRIDGDRVATATHTATLVARPPRLVDPRPGHAFQRELLTVAPGRIAKIQRVRHGEDGLSAEVLRRSPGGWQLVRVSGTLDDPVRAAPEALDDAMVRGILVALLLGEAERVALARPADQAIRRDPRRRELAVLIEAMDQDRASDIERIEATTRREWGLALRPDPDGGWEAVSIDGTLRHHLSDDWVAACFRSLERATVVAIQPGLVQAVAVTPVDARPFRLHRAGDGWRVILADDRRFEADAASVRAWLGELARLEARSVAADALPLAGDGPRQGLVAIELPGLDAARDRLELVVGVIDGDRVPVSDGTGRMYLAPSDAAVLLPPVGRFLTPADLRDLARE